MAKTTYLLGAGASFGSLPTVDGFENEIFKIIEILNGYLESSRIDIRIGKHVSIDEILKEALSDLNKLYIGCVEHRSVDTYAKKLFLTSNDTDYRKAKCAIILFFELFRYFYKQTDKRYDAFLATILSKNHPKLPKDINILSWNYDYEFERAYMKYVPDKRDINEVYEDLNIIHKNSKEDKSIANNFGILKINGTAGFFKNNKPLLGLGHNDLFFEEVVKKSLLYNEQLNRLEPILRNYYEYVYISPNEYEPAISFAWEDDEGMKQIKKEIKTVLSNTEKLIVIGYSFPYFNREIDKYVMNCIGDVDIYVQDTKERVDDLISNLKELRKQRRDEGYRTQFIPKTDLTQFYMAFD